MPLHRRSSRRRIRDGVGRLAILVVVVALAMVGSTPAASADTSRVAVRASAAVAEDGFGIRPEEGQIERLYLAVFGRAPEPGGFEYWLVRRTGGLTLDRVADFFIDSPEYRTRFGTPADADFIDRLYRNVLDRRPDTGGKSYWSGQLADGMARRRVVVLFSESAEFIKSTGTGLPALRPFAAESAAVTAASLGASWRSGCPVGPADLVQLTLSYIGFDGASHAGRIVVHRFQASSAERLFAEMYRARMPIERMQPAADFGGDDDAMMAVNNTSGFNCRAVTGGSGWSRHAFGRALDINPRQNPYVTSSITLPPEGAAFVDRTRYHPAMFRSGDPLVVLARRLGWRWGGDWISLKDYQHFDISG